VRLKLNLELADPLAHVEIELEIRQDVALGERQKFFSRSHDARGKYNSWWEMPKSDGPIAGKLGLSN
jgi:hypothetical protein